MCYQLKLTAQLVAQKNRLVCRLTADCLCEKVSRYETGRVYTAVAFCCDIWLASFTRSPLCLEETTAKLPSAPLMNHTFAHHKTLLTTHLKTLIVQPIYRFKRSPFLSICFFAFVWKHNPPIVPDRSFFPPVGFLRRIAEAKFWSSPFTLKTSTSPKTSNPSLASLNQMKS